MASKKQQNRNTRKPEAWTESIWKDSRYRYAVLLLLLTFLVFGNSINNGFTYDDKPFISQNHLVKQGFRGIPELLVTDFWEGYTNVHQVNPSWRPVPLISLAIEYQLFGLNPRMHHFFNVLMYGLNCVLLFFLLHACFRKRFPYLALITAMVFCVHPIHTEVVANIKGRDDLLALLFGLSALLLAIRYAERKETKLIVGALVCYLLALMSKEHLLTWVAIVPLTLYFFSGLTIRKILVYSSLFWGVSVCYYIIRSGVTGNEIVQKIDLIDNPVLAASGIGEIVASRIAVMGLFVKKLLVPYPLSSDYSYQSITVTNWSNPEVYVWLLFYTALIWIAITGFKKKKLSAFAILFYLLTILPVSNILFAFTLSFGERLMYTPSVGFILLFCLLCYMGYHGLERREYLNPQTLKNIAIGFLTVVVLALSVLSFLRNPAWKDDYTLFSTDVQTMPSSVRLNINYAQELINRNTKDAVVPMNAELEEAKASLERTLRLIPDFPRAILLYGTLSRITGNIDDAEKYYAKSRELDPDNPAVYFNLGLVAHIRDDLDKAKEYYVKSLELFPNYSAVLSNLGIIYGRKNELDKCIEVLEKAVLLEPDVVNGYANLEQAYSLKGDKIKADYYKNMRIKLTK